MHSLKGQSDARTGDFWNGSVFERPDGGRSLCFSGAGVCVDLQSIGHFQLRSGRYGAVFSHDLGGHDERASALQPFDQRCVWHRYPSFRLAFTRAYRNFADHGDYGLARLACSKNHFQTFGQSGTDYLIHGNDWSGLFHGRFRRPDVGGRD